VLVHNNHTVTTTQSGSMQTKRLSLIKPNLYSRYHSINLDKPRVLITGGAGQIGIELFTALSKRYGYGNVILSDVAQLSRKSFGLLAQSAEAELKDVNGLPFRFVDVTSEASLSKARRDELFVRFLFFVWFLCCFASLFCFVVVLICLFVS
jgi:hypothetical protein